MLLNCLFGASRLWHEHCFPPEDNEAGTFAWLGRFACSVIKPSADGQLLQRDYRCADVNLMGWLQICELTAWQAENFTELVRNKLPNLISSCMSRDLFAKGIARDRLLCSRTRRLSISWARNGHPKPANWIFNCNSDLIRRWFVAFSSPSFCPDWHL